MTEQLPKLKHGELLADPITVAGERVVMKYFSQIAASPAEALCVQLFAELHAVGQITGTGVDWNSQAVALEHLNSGEVLALITWREHTYTRDAFITLGGVTPTRRRRGLYSTLFKHFERMLIERHPDVDKITSGYHSENEASAKMQASLQRRVTHFHTERAIR